MSYHNKVGRIDIGFEKDLTLNSVQIVQVWNVKRLHHQVAKS